MDVREKLVELLCKVQDYGTKNTYEEWSVTVENKDNETIADRLIAHGVTVQEWISVKDRLPKPFTPVLVYRQSFGTLPPYIKVDKMTLRNDDTQVWTDEVGNWKNVTTHWMPLPQLPKGESEES